MAKSTAVITQEKAPFMSVSQLVSASWERLKLSWKNILLLYLCIYAASFIGLLFIALIVIGGSAASLLQNVENIEAMLAQTLTTMAPLAITLFVVYLIAMAVVGSIAGVAMLLAVAKAEEKPSLGSLLSSGVKLFAPLLLTSLIVGFLTIGGMFLLVIPGLLISIYLSFASYEVIIGGKKYLEAMKGSVAIIQQNIGELVVRYLIVIGIAIGISLVEGILRGIFRDVAVLSSLVGLISMVVQAGLGIFIINYMYLLYNEGRAHTDFTRPASMTWMWIVSIIGWLIGVVFLLVMGAAVARLIESGVLKEAMNDPEFQDAFNSSSNGYQLDSAIQMDDNSVIDADALIEQYGSELSDEEKELLRNTINGIDMTSEPAPAN